MIRNLNLTGEDVRAAEENGGSVLVDGGRFTAFDSVLTRNRAYRGGSICGENGAQIARILRTSLKVLQESGEGIYCGARCKLIVIAGWLHNNKATGDGYAGWVQLVQHFVNGLPVHLAALR